MSETSKKPVPAHRHIGCFGEHDPEDPVCKRFCALRLRCAIEKDQNVRLELIEDLMSYDDLNLKLQ